MNKQLGFFNDVERAATFFVYNRITFSGTSLSGGFSESVFTGRFTETIIERLLGFSKTIRIAVITNFDYKYLVEKEGNNVFIFLGHPYLYRHFATIMQNCKHKWLITYEDSEYIRKLFYCANIFPWNLTYGIRNITNHSNQNGKELFISNYIEHRPQL